METQETKRCPQCNTNKPIQEFHFRKSENRYQSWCKTCLYTLQKARWKDRKRKGVELLGGKCCRCGYNKNLAALHFHHRDPNIKEFDFGKLRQKAWAIIVEELKKCNLLCANCHAEEHAPELNLIMEDTGTSNCNLNTQDNVIFPTGKCPTCDKEVYGTRYCSVECASIGHRKVLRPTKIELDNLIKDSSIYAVSKKYGVSWHSVRKWMRQYGAEAV